MRILSILASVLVLAGCSGGSGNSTDSTPGSAANGALLVFDGEAATDSRLTARLAVVALEQIDGRISANLLTEQVPITLADPLGGTMGLPMGPIPAGEYVAIHLHFVPGSAVETMRDGTSEGRLFASDHQRITFARASSALEVPQWIVVGHAAPLVHASGPDPRLRPQLYARLEEPHLVRDLAVRILTADPGSESATAEIPVLRNLAVLLDFTDAERLVWDDQLLSVFDFLSLLREGTELRIDALLIGWRELRVISAVTVDNDPVTVPRPREKTDILGTLVEVHPDRGPLGEVVVRVQIVEKGGRDLPSTRPLDVTIWFDDRTKVKRLRVRGHHAHGPRYGDIDELATGMFVKVKWRGPLEGLTVTGEKIEIRGLGLGDQDVHRWYEGRIAALDASQQRFDIEVANSNTPVTVAVDGDSVIVGPGPSGGFVLLEFDDLADGDAVSVLGVRDANDVVQADLARVR